jgi:hypothetical protein
MKPKTKPAKTKSSRPKMPKFLPIDDEMKELSAMLEKEISDWTGVTKKPMFGFQGLYRNGVIFAALPRSRAINSPSAIMLKFATTSPAVLDGIKKDSRFGTVSIMSKSGWLTYDLNEASATKDALRWIGRAYEAAKK